MVNATAREWAMTVDAILICGVNAGR